MMDIVSKVQKALREEKMLGTSFFLFPIRSKQRYFLSVLKTFSLTDSSKHSVPANINPIEAKFFP